MATLPRELIANRRNEMLVVLTALAFIDQHRLLSREQLADAKRSLQALFIRTSGEETMLRRLLAILRANRELRQAFSAVTTIQTDITNSVSRVSRRINHLKHYVARLPLTPEENRDFFDPLMAFSHAFLVRIQTFEREVREYIGLREEEARLAQEHRIAEQARERLRQRLAGPLHSSGMDEYEASMRDEVLESFDHLASAQRHVFAQAASQAARRRVEHSLEELQRMSLMAMNPTMRESENTPAGRGGDDAYPDVYRAFKRALLYYPRIATIEDYIIDYFRLYQRAYGLFQLDFRKLHKAARVIVTDPQAYEAAKREDENLRSKQAKLEKYERLIPFLEAAAQVVDDSGPLSVARFSHRVSDLITRPGSEWAPVADDLLTAKVSAEADLTTRMEP